jgi:hypothetical protein
MPRAVALIFVLFLTLIALPFSAALTKDTSWYAGPLAGWVQAVGSIIAVAAAAFISVMQADDQRRRDVEALRLRAVEAAEDRVQMLLTAIKVCEWAQLRLNSLAGVIRADHPLAAAGNLSMVIGEFAAFEARLAALTLHGQHAIVRENILGAQGFLIAINGRMSKGIADIRKPGSDAAAVRDQLATDMETTAANLGDVVMTLHGGIARLRAQVAAVEHGH